MNNKFFNTITTVIVTALLLVTGGCKKYLDQRPITEVGPDEAFKDVESAYKNIISVYSRLVGDQGYGIRVSLYYPLDNDEMQGPTGTPDNDRRDIARYLTNPGNLQLERPFNQMFQGIEYANICIDNIPKMEMYTNGTDQEKKKLQRMYGEALTLRAQFYFEAIRNWGDLPMHFEPAYKIASANPFPVRVDRDTLYNRLIEDLRIAATLVPWRNELSAIGDAMDERITKGTVKGLRARLALFRGGYSLRKDGTMKRSSDYLNFYTIAKEECAEIMASTQHTLNPSFRALWKDQVCARAVADPNGELMFQASGIGLTGAEDTKLGYYNGPRVNNLGNSSVNPIPTYLYLFDSTDLRRDVTIAAYFVAANGSTKIGQAITAMNDGKYRRDWISNPVVSPTNAVQYFSLKWQILRYSDVLLMYAEAENELNGPSTSAHNAINQVRRRGYGQPINSPYSKDISVASKDEMFKAIVRERALELGGEGIRKYDLIRWNLLGTALAESKANMVKMSLNQAMLQPTYMAGYPTYSLSTGLPQFMYYFTTTTSDLNNMGAIWANSLYFPAPGSTPSGTTRVNWVRGEVNTVANARFATGFQTGKGELLPIPQPARDANFNLTQNPMY